VTGVAGSGKSSLVHGHLPRVAPDAVLIDQSPIRGSRRSTPASWTGMLDEIRRLYAARTGQPAALFSPNSDGACRACEGSGLTVTDLGFADAFTFFTDRKLLAIIERAQQVGLGYLTLGQDLTTLSGGERQRLKLARELSGRADIIVLDEPTTGLHAKDTEHLLSLLHDMVEDGRTVIVIEHDLDVIAQADHIIDLGPEGGHHGGKVQFVGPVTELLRSHTHTGSYLRARRDG
jgi:excinuclease UvrABC ATPase subunit